jgi:hypothetical protein
MPTRGPTILWTAFFETSLSCSTRWSIPVLIGVALADIGMVHDERTAMPQNFEIAVIGAADRNAVIAGSRLNPDILESGLANNSAVGHTVQRDAAGDT